MKLWLGFSGVLTEIGMYAVLFLGMFLSLFYDSARSLYKTGVDLYR